MFYFYILLHACVLSSMWGLLLLAPKYSLFAYIFAVLYIVIAETYYVHGKHHHFHIKKLLNHTYYDAQRINLYGIILPLTAWFMTSILLQWFYEATQIAFAILGFLVLMLLYYFRHPNNKFLQKNDNVITLLENCAKFSVVFMVTTVLYGFLFGYGSTFSLNNSQFAWQIMLWSLLMMLQAHHRYKRHELKTETLLVLASWVVAMFALLIAYLHIPFLTGSLLITIFYASVWSIFSSYDKHALSKHIILENIALLLLLMVIILTTTSYGQIL